MIDLPAGNAAALTTLGADGGPRTTAIWAGFEPAVNATGLSGITPPALRHAAASLAIAAGANVKVVQTMLGHRSATMTLDLYGHLFEDQLDEVADALDSARAAADFLRTKPARVRTL